MSDPSTSGTEMWPAVATLAAAVINAGVVWYQSRPGSMFSKAVKAVDRSAANAEKLLKRMDKRFKESQSQTTTLIEKVSEIAVLAVQKGQRE